MHNSCFRVRWEKVFKISHNYATEATMTKTVEIQDNEFVVGLNDLNRLFDAVEHFKPVTVATYAKTKGVSVQSVYKRIKNEKLVTINIDGITFIIL